MYLSGSFSRPMRNKESASWVKGTGSHGVLGEVDGTVQVDAGVRERAVGDNSFGRKNSGDSDGDLILGGGNYPKWKSYSTDSSGETDLEMAFLADNKDTVTTRQTSQEIPTLVIFQANDFDAFDFDYDEVPSASAVLMAKLSEYELDVLSENLDVRTVTIRDDRYWHSMP
nr:hypothetical protein [Tanacetum cinerariifolium]